MGDDLFSAGLNTKTSSKLFKTYLGQARPKQKPLSGARLSQTMRYGSQRSKERGEGGGQPEGLGASFGRAGVDRRRS